MVRECSATDQLYGVGAIAAELGVSSAKVFQLKAHAGLPTFEIGRTLCASLPALRAWQAARDCLPPPPDDDATEQQDEGLQNEE